MEEQHEVFTLIEEITRNDGTKYYEIGNMVHIPHSQNVINYEHFINTHYQMQDESMDHWEEWKRTPEADQLVKAILRENRVG